MSQWLVYLVLIRVLVTRTKKQDSSGEFVILMTVIKFTTKQPEIPSVLMMTCTLYQLVLLQYIERMLLIVMKLNYRIQNSGNLDEVNFTDAHIKKKDKFLSLVISQEVSRLMGSIPKVSILLSCLQH